jgi:proteasome accessory factor B
MEARELTFDYHKLHAPRPARRSVRPYHIRCIENQWYLFAYDLGRKDLRTFVLNRIVHLGKPGARFEKPADFDIEERLRSCFGVFRETHTYKVRIRFDAFAARLVAERAWHPSQVLKTFRNGEVELSFTLSSLIEVERWVLSWGRHATVQTPKELRERIRENVAELAARYEPRDGVPAEPRQAFLFGDDKPARQLLFDLNPRKSTRLAALDGLQEIEDSLADLN